MIKYKNNARFAGAMFLMAMVASLTGGTLIQGVLDKPDFMTLISSEKEMMIVGIVLEFTNAFAVIGIIAALWVPLKKTSPSMAVGYFGLRIIESMSCVIAAFAPIVIMAFPGQETDVLPFAIILNVVRANVISYAIPLFFGIGGLLLNVMLYRAHLVPKYLAVWGIIAAPAVMLNMFVPAGEMKPLLALPIIANEIYLGIYLLVTGFQDNKGTIRG